MRSLFVLLCLLFGSDDFAQGVSDFGIWGSVSYNTDIFDALSLTLEQEVRMEQNASTPGVIFTNVGIDYRLNKKLEVGLNYRFILNDRPSGIYGHRHRAMLDVQYRERFQQWTISYRVRGQSEVRTINYSDRFGFAPTADLRNTFKTTFRVNRQIDVYGSFDLRVLIREPRVPNFSGVDRLRYRVGTEKLLKKGRAIGLFIQYQREVNVENPQLEFNVGIGYKFSRQNPLFQN